MTPELIKQWAKESGFQERQDGFRDSGDPSHYFDCWPEELEAFAALVAAHQRELDAKVCEAGIDQAKEDELSIKSRKLDGQDGELQALKFWSTVSLYNNARKLCAAAIRAQPK